MTFFSRYEGRTLALVVHQLWIGVVLEQQFHHGTVAVLRRGMNGNPTSLLPGVNRRSVFEQHTRGLQILGRCRRMQGHDAGRIQSHGINRRSALDQQARGFGLAEKAGKV
jgi:hypothetical protein